MPLSAIRRLFGSARANRVAKPEALKIFRRDDFHCRYCGMDGRASFENWLILTVDFVHPVARGGTKRSENLVTACQPCNKIKGLRVFPTFKDARTYVLQRREEWRAEYLSQTGQQVHAKTA